MIELQITATVKLNGRYYTVGELESFSPEDAKVLLDAHVAKRYLPPTPTDAVPQKDVPESVEDKQEEITAEAEADALEELKQVAGVTEELARLLIKADVLGIEKLQKMTSAEIVGVLKIAKKEADKILKDAKLFECE